MHAMGQSWRAHPARLGRAWRGAVLLATLCLLSACRAGIPAVTTPTACPHFGDELPITHNYDATVPAMSDGRLYVQVSETDLGISGAIGDPHVVKIVALRASDGKLLWQRPNPLGQPGNPYPPVGLVSISADHDLLIVSNRGGLVALRASDGTVLWQVFSHGSQGYSYPYHDSYAAPVVFGQDVFYASDDTGLYAARVSDGQVLWQLRRADGSTCPLGHYCDPSSQYSHLILAAGVVYAGSPLGTVVAVRASDGAVLWRTPFLSPLSVNEYLDNWPLPLAVDGGYLYVAGTDHGLLQVRVSDGRIEGTPPGLPLTTKFDIVGVDGTFDIGVSDNQGNYLLRTPSGKLLWTVYTNGRPRDVMAVDNGVLYVNGAFYGNVVAFRLSDGSLLWSYAGQAQGRAVGGGHVYLSQSEGKIVCSLYVVTSVQMLALNEEDGSVAWTQHLNIAQ